MAIAATVFGAAASAQTSVSCQSQAIPVAINSAGLTERVGDVQITCTGGNAGSQAIGSIYVTLNGNITNSLDADGNLQGITVTSQGAPVTDGAPVLSGSATIQIPNLQYTVANPLAPVHITVSGLRVAAALINSDQGRMVVNATLVGIGFSLPSLVFPVAIGSASLAASVQNNGVPCTIIPAPSSADFASFINAGFVSSAVRVTETTAAALTPKTAGTSNGSRIIVKFAGYGPNVQLWVPNAIVGNSGSTPTSAGQFGASVAGGLYTPNANQLLLSLVAGADQNGNGGNLVTGLPTASASFVGLTQLSISGGAAFAVYEVLDQSAYVQESFQIPVFVQSLSSDCSQALVPTLSVREGPVSTVSVPTATDPVPRFAATDLAPDCQLAGDCNQAYFPVLSVDTEPVNLTASAQGLTTSTSVPILNNGGSLLSYTTSIAYESGMGWLSVSPAAGDVKSGLALKVIADPLLLQQGAYAARVTINGGEGGSASFPVNFTVSPSGPTIGAIVSAASFQGGITPGSYVAIFGSRLDGSSVSVTFGGQSA
ncbi:MAG TPA: hypothetical protein VN519_11240, partial [Bryobacteraceae bacterium]|nr:hypothetical protein [Bryobacteraceae bacterium]